MLKIKFSKCPLGKHKGEYWEKLNGIPNGSIVSLISVSACINLPTDEEIQKDTFSDWNIGDFIRLLKLFYGMEYCVLLKLTFSYTHSDIEKDSASIWIKKFTTFRAYEWRKHKYYLDNLGKEFEVVLT